jgi:hypothetical protein
MEAFTERKEINPDLDTIVIESTPSAMSRCPPAGRKKKIKEQAFRNYDRGPGVKDPPIKLPTESKLAQHGFGRKKRSYFSSVEKRRSEHEI